MTITLKIRHLLGLEGCCCWTCRNFNGTACASEHDFRRAYTAEGPPGPFEGWPSTFLDDAGACGCYRKRLKDGSI